MKQRTVVRCTLAASLTWPLHWCYVNNQLTMWLAGFKHIYCKATTFQSGSILTKKTSREFFFNGGTWANACSRNHFGFIKINDLINSFHNSGSRTLLAYIASKNLLVRDS